jgi:hypothetical protein
MPCDPSTVFRHSGPVQPKPPNRLAIRGRAYVIPASRHSVWRAIPDTDKRVMLTPSANLLASQHLRVHSRTLAQANLAPSGNLSYDESVRFRLNKKRLRSVVASWASPVAAGVATTAVWWALDVHNLNVILWGDLVIIAISMKLTLYVRSRLRQRRLG